jgi:murein DD-endopeptidase MepM/ murein hydrolase activator NlpD
MRWAAVIVATTLIWACPARGDDLRLDWPLRPYPAVVRSFDAPAPDWNRGHRGVDLAGRPGQPVYAAGAGTVVYTGMLAGRQVVSLAHPGGLHTSYEPVRASVRVGQPLTAGTVIGELLAGHPGCPVSACLHWGAMWGPAARADYVDPLGLVASTPIRLKPLRGAVEQRLYRPPHQSLAGRTTFGLGTAGTPVARTPSRAVRPADGPGRAPRATGQP